MIQTLKYVGKMHKQLFVSALTAAASTFVPRSVRMAKKFDEEYDLAVIGGGSGGLATAFQANKHGLKTIVIDFVEESPQKTKWGLGGTCVNVGCIPKKLMHQAGKHGQNIIDAYDYGWQLENNLNEREQEHNVKKYFNWTSLRNMILNHIKQLNFGYVSNINKQSQMDYLNAMATFIDKNTLLCSKNPDAIRNYVKTKKQPEDSDTWKINAKNFVIATGTRPNYLKCQGAQLAITSDDIFFKKTPPNKTLVVGGGYVAVEVAGFLNSMGFNTTLTTRGKYLRLFDQDMVKEVIGDLQQRKVNFIPTSLPTSLRKINDNEIQVQLKNQETNQILKQTFNTVLFATGRSATTDLLNLESVGVQRSSSNKILTQSNEVEKTNVDNIYALGDVVEGLPQLTSTAVKMGQHLGRRLAHRIKNKQFPKNKMFIDLDNYPTTVFTPLEYAVCGLSEEKSKEIYGKENVQSYHIKYLALEEEVLSKYNEDGGNYKSKVYAKAIVLKDSRKVVGLHYTGPNAGQIMQGFAAAMKMGLTKEILDQTIGIHPTVAENITMMTATKESGEKFEKTSC